MAIIDFNLIASTFKYGEENAQEELLHLLEILGDQEPESQITDINGILVAYTNLALLRVVDSLRQLVKNEPWQIRYVLRLLPIESVIHTNLEDIGNAARKLTQKIGIQDTFRITVERRHTHLGSADIIAKVGKQINNTVNLKNPDWIVLVEIIGALTGISILRPNQIFSSIVEKRTYSK
jgi:tRNA acetyltransferase TAN1